MRQKNRLELSLLNPLPYQLKDVESGFTFETDFGVTYEIVFTDDSDICLSRLLLIPFSPFL